MASHSADGAVTARMDMTSTSDSSMVMMVFQNVMNTPLYSSAWTPSNTGTYAATCIFLIVLGVIFRCLLAAKSLQEARWLDREFQRRYVAVQGKRSMAERVSNDSLAKTMVLSENGVEEQVMVVAKHGVRSRPWRLSVDPVRALIDTLITGVGYLLMLAVMTMNVGYFMSVLAGAFLGSLLVGRYVHGFDG